MGRCWRRSRWPRRSRARATASTAACRARATCVRDPELADAIERLAADGAAPFYTGDIGGAVSDWVAARGGTLTRADLAAYATVPREPVRVRYHGREVLTNPPPSAGGMLIAYALALLERGAGAARRAPSSSTAMEAAQAERTPAFLEGLGRARLPGGVHGLAARLDDARLGARRRRLGVRGHDDQRRGLGDRRPRHRHPRQQHDGRAGPLARGLVHAPARAPAAVDDGADRRARRRLARARARLAPARTGSAPRSCR